MASHCKFVNGTKCYLQEEEKRGTPNYEHLDEPLHVLITVEDTEKRAGVKLAKAVEKVKDLLSPVVCSAATSLLPCHS